MSALPLEMYMSLGFSSAFMLIVTRQNPINSMAVGFAEQAAISVYVEKVFASFSLLTRKNLALKKLKIKNARQLTHII